MEGITERGPRVLFLDYGNTDVVEWGKVCRKISELAADAEMDQYVLLELNNDQGSFSLRLWREWRMK